MGLIVLKKNFEFLDIVVDDAICGLHEVYSPHFYTPAYGRSKMEAREKLIEKLIRYSKKIVDNRDKLDEFLKEKILPYAERILREEYM